MYQEIFQKSITTGHLKVLNESKERVNKGSQNNIVKLRVVSIDRDSGKSKIPFLAMNEQGLFLAGTDEIVPNALIQCTPSELDRHRACD